MKSLWIIIFTLTLYSYAHAQAFQFSAHDETSFLSLSGISEIKIAPFTKFAFSTKYSFDEINAIDLRLGYLFIEKPEIYSGPEFGLYYHILLLHKSNLYGFAGVNSHSASMFHPRSRTAVLAVIGLGMPLSQLFSVEVIYNKAIKERYYEGNSRIFYEIDLGIAILLGK